MAPLWLSWLSSQMIMAGSLDSSTKSVRKLPMPCRRNILIWSDRALPWMTLGYPVANMPCQNKDIFSCSGVVVVAMRKSQFSPEAFGPIIPESSGWKRRMRSSPILRSSTGFSSSSAVASYPWAA